MTEERVTADLTVVGGGLAGLSAAVQAARFGIDVALVNDRPVLGGNSSSEIRVWPSGSTGGINNRYAREGGIMEELTLTHKARNPSGNADLWDMVLQDLVLDEPNVSLYLNTLVDEIDVDGNGTEGSRIVSVAGTQSATERRFRFESPLFVDATGDGVLAERAGAPWRLGRESRDEFGEVAAPEEPDEKTLGHSIMFYTVERDEPVEFTPPDFAHDFRDDPPSVLAKRAAPNRNRCLWWWIEYGGEEDLDPIRDNEEIRDELWAIVFGAWDYMKNSGEFDEEDVSNLELAWVGKRPGKRESRRIEGEYVLTESDIVEQRDFDDAVAHGGWSIDLHPPEGFYDELGRGTEHWHLDGPYSIPYRITCPNGVDNLLLAGRHVSASHVAFGSIRVQATLSTVGQAVGAAAWLCDEHDARPVAVADEHVDELQQALLREDQWILGVPGEDPDDLAREASASASSTQPFALRQADTAVRLDESVGVHLSTDERVETVRLRLESDVDEPATVDVEIWSESQPQNYLPDERRETVAVEVPAGGPSWVEVPVSVEPTDGQGIFLVLEENPGVTIYGRTREFTGALASAKRELTRDQLVEAEAREHYWPSKDWVPCFEIDPEPDLRSPETVVDGYARPYGVPHGWLSEPFESVSDDGDGAVAVQDVWLELSWDEQKTLAALQFAFNSDLTPWYSALLPTDTPRVDETIRDYRVEYLDDDEWSVLFSAAGNYQRFRRHAFDPIETEAIRLVVEATNGTPWAELFEVRAYGPDQTPPLTER